MIDIVGMSDIERTAECIESLFAIRLDQTLFIFFAAVSARKKSDGLIAGRGFVFFSLIY